MFIAAIHTVLLNVIGRPMYRTRPTYSLWRHPNFPKSNGGPNPHPNITPAIRPNPSRTEPGYSSSIGLYNDRRPTATQYDRLLPWHHHVRLFVCLSVTLLWLSESVYRAKTCTSVFLATNKFLFVHSDTFVVVCIVRTLTQNARKNESKKTRRQTMRRALVV